MSDANRDPPIDADTLDDQDTPLPIDGTAVEAALSAALDAAGFDIEDGATVVWDSSQGFVPQAQVEQGAGSGLDADTVDGSHAADLGGATVKKIDESFVHTWDTSGTYKTIDVASATVLSIGLSTQNNGGGNAGGAVLIINWDDATTTQFSRGSSADGSQITQVNDRDDLGFADQIRTVDSFQLDYQGGAANDGGDATEQWHIRYLE